MSIARRTLACIDVGTNTVLMLLAELGADGTVTVLEDAAEITRLGEGLDASPRLRPEAAERTLAVLGRLAARARAAGAEVHAVGTAALRRAEDGAAFLKRARDVLGADLEIISGEREAELSFGAVASSFPELAGRPLAVIDVGGGSTEVISGEAGRVRSAVSYEIGSVRLTERCLRSDPPAPAELAALDDAVTAALVHVTKAPPEATVVGVAGTVTTLVAVRDRVAPYDGARVHGQRLSLADVERLLAYLASLPLEERRALPGLEPKRADVIVAGAAVVAGALRALGHTSLVVSDRGVRWGLCYEKLRA